MSHRRYTYLVKEDILLLKRRYTAFLKETHRSFIRSGMGALLLWLLLLTACVGEELQKPLLGEGEGYLRLQVAPVSAEITTSPLTKAEIPTEQIPKPNQCAIKITNKSTDKSTSYANSDALPNPLVLKAGVTYTVEAYHGENNTLQETPYFHGSSEVTIQPNQSNDATINVVFANAMLVPEVDQNLAKHYSTWKLTASTSDKSFTFAEKDKTSTSQKTLYAKAGENVTFTFSGKNLAEKEVSSTWTKTFDAGYAYQLQCNPNLTAFEKIEVKATAEHTYDNDNGYLTGTNITSFNAISNGVDLKAIASWQVDVKYGEKTIRTYTGASLDNMTCEDNDWPYIPQGSTLSASVTLKSKDEISDLKGTFTSLPAPDFKVSVSAQTSYSVYKNEGAAAANEKNGSSIFDIGSTVKISDEILTNSNYANILPKVTYTTDTSKSSGELAYNASVNNFTGLAWQKHVLTATATFDGAIASASIDCHVTGLPYRIDFRQTSDKVGWDFVGTTEHSDKGGYRLYYAYTNSNRCNAFSPPIYAPKAIKTISTANIFAGTTLSNDKTYTIYIGATTGTTVVQEYSITVTEVEYIGTSSYQDNLLSIQTELSNGMRISITHNANLGKNQGSHHYIFLPSFNMYYSN